MKAPDAIVVAWIGPSDRPNPPLVLGVDQKAIDGAGAWIAKRGHAPIGFTKVQVDGAGLACINRSVPSQAQGNLIQVAAWSPGSEPVPVSLEANSARAFLDAAITCLGEQSAGAGYVRSLKVLVDNASR